MLKHYLQTKTNFTHYMQNQNLNNFYGILNVMRSMTQASARIMVDPSTHTYMLMIMSMSFMGHKNDHSQLYVEHR